MTHISLTFNEMYILKNKYITRKYLSQIYFLNPKKLKVPVANTDNKINKLVTVFALILCTLDNIWRGDKPGFPPLLIETSVTVDNNWRASTLYRDTAPVLLATCCNRGQHMARITSVPRHS